jgi:RimJ/RimL family protein N-acetyltransferase
VKQSAHPFPDQLAAARIRLQRYHASHAQGVLRLIDRNRERLMRNFPELANGVKSVEAASAYLVASEKQWADSVAFVYGIWCPSEPDPIGQLRIKNMVWNVPSAELSYFVDREWLRKGVATEAVRAVLREAFAERGFKRVYVRIIGANEESLALARRLQLRHEGVHRNSFRCGLGELHDVHLFAMTDGDYNSNPAG